MIVTFWKGLSRGARAGLVAGGVLVLALTAGAAWWLLRTDYQVLFADLTPQDTAAMTAELERLKVPYSLAEESAAGGTTILVDRSDVYRTRIKLMGKDIPLHGAVGFELFNNSDFGMTEFAQKINYQRALQGELTRTILSLSEIRDARVLLALPEQGLFKQATSKAKASITVSLKYGQALRPEQVTGIQRLVSAAVPGIATQDVTIVDQSGVALTRASGDGDPEMASGRLDLKKDTEAYLTRKATQVLERALGAGQAIASVDVTLDMDRMQITTEDVIAAPGRPGQAQAGVMVRERETLRETGAPLNARGTADSGGGSSGGSSQRETEYAVGRRVEQVIGQPGSIRRIQVVAVVKKALDVAQQERIRSMVAASVGASLERGDTIVVHAIDGLVSPAGAERNAPAPGDGRELAAAHGEGPMLPRGREPRGAESWTAPGVLVAVAAAAGLWLLVSRRRKARAAASASRPGALSDAERQAALAHVQGWMRGDAARPRGDLS